MKQLGRGVGMALVAAGAVVSSIVYAARKKTASAATVVYQHGRRLVQGTVSSLTTFLPSFVFGG